MAPNWHYLVLQLVLKPSLCGHSGHPFLMATLILKRLHHHEVVAEEAAWQNVEIHKWKIQYDSAYIPTDSIVYSAIWKLADPTAYCQAENPRSITNKLGTRGLRLFILTIFAVLNSCQDLDIKHKSISIIILDSVKWASLHSSSTGPYCLSHFLSLTWSPIDSG